MRRCWAPTPGGIAHGSPRLDRPSPALLVRQPCRHKAKSQRGRLRGSTRHSACSQWRTARAVIKRARSLRALSREALEAIPRPTCQQQSFWQKYASRSNAPTSHCAGRRHGVDPMSWWHSTVVVMLARGDHFACLWAGNSAPTCCAGGSSCGSPATTASFRNCSMPVIAMNEAEEPPTCQRHHPSGRRLGPDCCWIRSGSAGARGPVPAVQRRAVQDRARGSTGGVARRPERHVAVRIAGWKQHSCYRLLTT